MVLKQEFLNSKKMIEVATGVIINNAHILLDSCILNNLLSTDKKLADETKDLLSSLYQNNNILYISEFSHYELIRSIPDIKRSVCE